MCMADCDFCGESSELIQGACAGCRNLYHLPEPETLQGEHAANDVHPVIFDRRRQDVGFDFQANPSLKLTHDGAPIESSLQYSVYGVPAFPAMRSDDVPPMYGRRADDERVDVARQEMLGIDCGVAA